MPGNWVGPQRAREAGRLEEGLLQLRNGSLGRSKPGARDRNSLCKMTVGDQERGVPAWGAAGGGGGGGPGVAPPSATAVWGRGGACLHQAPGAAGARTLVQQEARRSRAGVGGCVGGGEGGAAGPGGPP